MDARRTEQPTPEMRVWSCSLSRDRPLGGGRSQRWFDNRPIRGECGRRLPFPRALDWAQDTADGILHPAPDDRILSCLGCPCEIPNISPAPSCICFRVPRGHPLLHYPSVAAADAARVLEGIWVDPPLTPRGPSRTLHPRIPAHPTRVLQRSSNGRFFECTDFGATEEARWGSPGATISRKSSRMAIPGIHNGWRPLDPFPH